MICQLTLGFFVDVEDWGFIFFFLNLYNFFISLKIGTRKTAHQ